MKIRINSLLPVLGTVILLIMVMMAAGCLRSAQTLMDERGSDTGDLPEPGNQEGLSMVPSARNITAAPVVVPVSATPLPAATLGIEEISPDPYVTRDPYQLPYRDHGTWSTVEALRIEKIPQYSKSFVLRSNATAVKVNAPEAPLVIDLTFSPLYDNPDQTSGASGSYVHSKALVTVHQENSTAIMEQDGFGCGYSTAKEKTITLYREGTFVITLSGDFMDVRMDVTSGEGLGPVATPSPSGHSADFYDEEEW